MRTSEPTLKLIRRAFEAWFEGDGIPEEIADELEARGIDSTALDTAFDYDDLVGGGRADAD